jgi:DNA-binding MarR family transcriptional regulator
MAEMETTALRDRLMDGLDRFASAMRAEVRRSVASRGLNPAQAAILRLLLARPAGLRVRVLAGHLGVRQPTVTDSVIALERKGLVRRQADPADMPAPPSSRSRRMPSRDRLLPFPRSRPPLWRI